MIKQGRGVFRKTYDQAIGSYWWGCSTGYHMPAIHQKLLSI